jgi:hypothetical protein
MNVRLAPSLVFNAWCKFKAPLVLKLVSIPCQVCVQAPFWKIKLFAAFPTNKIFSFLVNGNVLFSFLRSVIDSAAAFLAAFLNSAEANFVNDCQGSNCFS